MHSGRVDNRWSDGNGEGDGWRANQAWLDHPDAPFYEFCAADQEASQIVTEILKAGTFESSYPFRNTPASKVA